MSSKNNDLNNLVEAYTAIHTQQIDEKGGFWDKQLAKSPIAKMFGGISDRAGARVANKEKGKTILSMFNRTLGRNKQPVDVGQLREFLARQMGVDPAYMNSLEGLPQSGTVEYKDVKNLIPDFVDQAQDAIDSGQYSPQQQQDNPAPDGSPGPAPAPAGGPAPAPDGGPAPAPAPAGGPAPAPAPAPAGGPAPQQKQLNPGDPHESIENLVFQKYADDGSRIFAPADGYEWASSDDTSDLTVKPRDQQANPNETAPKDEDGDTPAPEPQADEEIKPPEPPSLSDLLDPPEGNPPSEEETPTPTEETPPTPTEETPTEETPTEETPTEETPPTPTEETPTPPRNDQEGLEDATDEVLNPPQPQEEVPSAEEDIGEIEGGLKDFGDAVAAGAEEKIKEYVDRINNGEDIDAVTDGLPPNMKEEVRKRATGESTEETATPESETTTEEAPEAQPDGTPEPEAQSEEQPQNSLAAANTDDQGYNDLASQLVDAKKSGDTAQINLVANNILSHVDSASKTAATVKQSAQTLMKQLGLQQANAQQLNECIDNLLVSMKALHLEDLKISRMKLIEESKRANKGLKLLDINNTFADITKLASRYDN